MSSIRRQLEGRAAPNHGRPSAHPAGLAAKARDNDWRKITVDVRTPLQRLVYVRDVLWYAVNKRDLLRLVIVRDPDGVEPDDFFVTTYRSAPPAAPTFASCYAGRWSIEVAFRDVKQDLGAEDPQILERRRPESAACLSLWLHALIWCWCLDTHPHGRTWIPRPGTRVRPPPVSSTHLPRCAASCRPDRGGTDAPAVTLPRTRSTPRPRWRLRPATCR